MISHGHVAKTPNDVSLSDKQALDIHICVEGYFKRLFLIGLRFHEGQYETARQVVKEYWSKRLKELIKKAWNMADIEYDAATQYEGSEDVASCVAGFSAHYRNQRVHGGRDEITNQRLLAAIIGVDKEIKVP